MSKSSYSTTLRSSSIIGGATVINLASSIVRMKVAAVLLGPVGVGLIGLYTSLIQTASSIASLGLETIGTRQVAKAHAEGGEVAVGRTRRALFWGTMLLAMTGSALFWLASGRIARVIVADETRSNDVAWLSLGVALTVAAGSQGALLTGLRRIGDLARIKVGAGLIGTILAALALWLWGGQGLMAMVLIVPVVTFLLGHLYVGRLAPPAGSPVGLSEMSREWKVMLTLGFAFMLRGVVGTLGQLTAQTLVQRDFGPQALGHYQAAWAIGMNSLGLVLAAMGTDYYPRLTAAIRNHATAARLVNEQTEVALLLCSPVLLAMLGLVPWIVRLLYSEEFAPAGEILRWQLYGQVLKLLSWPLVFVILASGAGRTLVLVELVGQIVFLLGVVIGLNLLGVTGTGVAFLMLYVAYLPLVWWLGGRVISFHWTRAVKTQAVAVTGAAVVVDVAGRWSQPLGAILGLLSAFIAGLLVVTRLSVMVGAGGRLGRIARLGDRVKRWMSKR